MFNAQILEQGITTGETEPLVHELVETVGTRHERWVRYQNEKKRQSGNLYASARWTAPFSSDRVITPNGTSTSA